MCCVNDWTMIGHTRSSNLMAQHDKNGVLVCKCVLCMGMESSILSICNPFNSDSWIGLGYSAPVLGFILFYFILWLFVYLFLFSFFVFHFIWIFILFYLFICLFVCFVCQIKVG